MISKSKKGNPVIGRNVVPIVDLKSKGGCEIKAGTACKIVGSHRGYAIQTDDKRYIARVQGWQLREI